MTPADLTGDDLAAAQAQAGCPRTAFRWLRAVLADRDMSAAWMLTDCAYRRALLREYLGPFGVPLRGRGDDPDAVIEALAGADHPTHELWPPVAVVLRAGLACTLGRLADVDPERWGIGTAARPVGVDEAGGVTSLLYLHDVADGDVWQPGELRMVCPLLMRDGGDGGGWRVLAVGTDQPPALA